MFFLTKPNSMLRVDSVHTSFLPLMIDSYDRFKSSSCLKFQHHPNFGKMNLASPFTIQFYMSPIKFVRRGFESLLYFSPSFSILYKCICVFMDMFALLFKVFQKITSPSLIGLDASPAIGASQAAYMA